ncbi:MAG: cytochrome c [Myxococcota bacterium]
MRLLRAASCVLVATVAAACADSEEAPAPESFGGGDARAGAAHYRIYCATCHGETGCGDGPLSASLDPKPAKHCDGEYMNALSDDHLFTVVKEGGQAAGKSAQMAAWGGSLSDAQIIDVIAFMRSVADPPYQAP